MRAEDLQAALRPRTTWEAIDLGVALTRRHIGVVASWWLLVVTPICLLTWWALIRSPYLGLLVLWFIRPIFGLGQSVALSRGLFSPSLRLTELFAAAWSWRGWALGVLYRRLSPARGLRALMGQLEGLRGVLADRRWDRLGQGSVAATSALAFCCWTLKWWVSVSVFLAAPALFPESWSFNLLDAIEAFDAGSGDPTVLGMLFVADQVGLFVGESLFYAGSFGMYINQRVLRDGWDLELRLRGFVQAAAKTAVLALALLVVGVGSAWAQDTGEPELVVEEVEAAPARTFPPPNELDEAVERVLSDPDFGVEHTRRRWRLKKRDRDPEDEEDAPALPLNAPGAVGCPVTAPAAGVSAFVGIILLGIIVLIVRRGLPEDEPGADEPLFTLTSGSLPQEAPPPRALVEADARWAAGDEVGALGALYRGAVDRLIRQGVPAGPDHTEGEVRRLTRRAAPTEQAEAFERLCAAWSQVAYAKIPAGEARYKALRAEWPRWFGEGV